MVNLTANKYKNLLTTQVDSSQVVHQRALHGHGSANRRSGHWSLDHPACFLMVSAWDGGIEIQTPGDSKSWKNPGNESPGTYFLHLE